MGCGIAWQIGQTPGMRLTHICDLDAKARDRAAAAYAAHGDADVLVHPDTGFLRSDAGYDVLVEATNSIGPAGQACQDALNARKHVVLMNAEVDLAFGHGLQRLARDNGVILTSDAGDQHGVLMRMMDEIQLWGFRLVMAGNIKGFLNRHATARSLEREARIRRLSPIQCCAYTDGTKLNVEMALLANASAMVPSRTGMLGPTATHVSEVYQVFDFDAFPQEGVVDYVLGAEPGGGVFVVAHCEDAFQVPYLSYYKLGDGPYYLFYRPYHLCHLETPWAIAAAVLDGEPILAARASRIADVYAYAKRDLSIGDTIDHAIGGDACYGLIDLCRLAEPRNHVPLALLETEADSRETQVRLKRKVRRDMPLCWTDIDMPVTPLLEMHRKFALSDAPGSSTGEPSA